MRQGQGSFAAVAKEATERLRRSGKSDREKVTRVTRLLRRSGKSGKKKVAIVTIGPLRGSDRSDKSGN